MDKSLDKNVISTRRRIVSFTPPPPEPDWKVWTKVNYAPLWEAIALSCNIEPMALKGWQTSLSRIKPSKDFLLRYRLAESDSIKGRLKVFIPQEGTESQVALTDLRKWCEIQILSLPSRFPDLETIAERNNRIVTMYMNNPRRGIYSQLEKEFGISRQAITKIIKRLRQNDGQPDGNLL